MIVEIVSLDLLAQASREVAQRWHGEDSRKIIRSLYGSAPRIDMREALIRVDPRSATVMQLAAESP